MQGLIEYAKACNFESIELIAQCIDTSVQNVHKKEYELAQRYLSVLSFYKKHNALPHPAGSTPNFNPNENVKDFYTPLIIPLTTDAQQDIIARLQSAKIKKQPNYHHSLELYFLPPTKNTILTASFLYIHINNFLRKNHETPSKC